MHYIERYRGEIDILKKINCILPSQGYFHSFKQVGVGNKIFDKIYSISENFSYIVYEFMQKYLFNIISEGNIQIYIYIHSFNFF